MRTTSPRVLLIVNLHKDDSRSLMAEMQDWLEAEGAVVAACAFEGTPQAVPPGDFDVAFCLGGDGTVLFAARCLAPRGIPIIPVNLGTLGFIAAVHREGWREAFYGWKAGTVAVSERLMLDVVVRRGGEDAARFSCLNDAVIAASGISKIIRLDVETETIRLGRYRADGLIVATPTGSTAYSVAAGGPILDPEIEAIILNPVCPFTLSNRPVVVPAHETLSIRVEDEQRSEVMLTVDGQVVFPLEPSDIVRVFRAPRKARIVASDRGTFYRVLRSKLNWSGGPDA